MMIVYKFTQVFFTFLCWLLGKFWFRLEVKGAQNLKGLCGPLMMVSNHKSFGDHFFILAAMPKWRNSPLIPVRAMASDKLYSNFIKKFFISFLGTYPARKGEGFDVSLAKPIEILRNGGVVGFYPEGHRIRHQGIGEFKRGVGELVKRAPGVAVFPIAIRGTEDLLLQILPKPQGKIYVSFGKPLYPDAKQSAETITDIIRENILNLYNSAMKKDDSRIKIPDTDYSKSSL